MAEPAQRRPARRRRPWRRSALPRSRPALALGAVVAVVILILLLLGFTRARPGRDVPSFDPTSTTVSAPEVPRQYAPITPP